GMARARGLAGSTRSPIVGVTGPMASRDESPFSGLILAWPAIAALLVAVSGLLLARPRLDDSPRPTGTLPPQSRPAADGSVPGRLWQDPFGTVPTTIPREAGLNPALRFLDKQSVPQDKVCFFLAVVPAATTPEAVEIRRRERYAILSALSTAGFL